MPNTTAHTLPTQCLAKDATPTHHSTDFVEGIPLHALTIFDFTAETPTRPHQRLRRTAAYVWDDELLTAEEVREVMDLINHDCPTQPPTAPLELRWQVWHERVEAAIQHASYLGAATTKTCAERAKGSPPSWKNPAPPPSHRPD